MPVENAPLASRASTRWRCRCNHTAQGTPFVLFYLMSSTSVALRKPADQARSWHTAPATAVFFTMLAGHIGFSTSAVAQSSTWRLEPQPMLVLGKATGDESEAFAEIVGATRLPNGTVLVADRGQYSLHIYSPAGKEIKKFGRKGSGPGEFGYLARLYRCGGSILTYDIENGYAISVFSLDGLLSRTFRFSQKNVNNMPYANACNAAGTFLHFGWESRGEMKAGVYRPIVPVWLSGADSSAGRLLGTMQGSERWGQPPGGSGPLPLGREPRIAIGATRAYVGEATTYRVRVYSLTGQPLPDITKAVTTVPVTAQDIDAELERQVASDGERSRTRLTKYFSEIKMPKTLPPYRALLVDGADLLWVQDYAKSASGTVSWTIFDPAGKQVATIPMPYAFDVYEVGTDYVLGRYIDADDAIPQVRLYRLHRRAR